MVEEIIHYDLFAGIGGFSLALEEAFNDAQIKHVFSEWGLFPTAILKKHWAEGTFYGDIKDLITDTERPRWERCRSQGEGRHGQLDRKRHNQTQGLSILTGGFPCQPFSHAGRRKGTADDRYQWPNMLRVIQNVKPDWIIAENVRGLATWNEGMVLEQICTDLEAEGYEVQPFIIPAVAVNAPHRRDRVWIIAKRTKDATDTRPQRRSEGSNETLQPESQKPERANNKYPNWERGWREVAAATCYDGVDDGLPRRLDGATERGKVTNQISAAKWRKESLKAYGNAIVPQVAIEIFKSIKKTIAMENNNG